jgi:membrane protein
MRAWTRRRRLRLRGYNPWEIALDAIECAVRHRVGGFAAEMAFFASLALIPFTAALGGVLGYLERIAGPDGVRETERMVIELMTIILGPDMVVDVVAPFVQAELSQTRGGLAIVALIGGLWLASRVFLPAVHALDLAYDAVEDRSVLRRRGIALVLASASMVVITLQLLLLVFGPLLGGGRELAAKLGLGSLFTVLWNAGRWPLLGLVLTLFLLAVYRYVPSRRVGWRRSLPGALVAVCAWLLVAVAFRVYLDTGIRPGQGVAAPSEATVAVGRVVGALVATVLWVFLSSIAILFGGEVNAAIQRQRAG